MSDLMENNRPKVAVVIVNWNGERFLERCLSALLAQTVAPLETIVLDNASTDMSLDVVRRFPSVRVLAKNDNLGFARGNNQAIEAVSQDVEWIALLNPDAFPEPTWLETLTDAAKKHLEYSFFGSMLINAKKPFVLDGEGDIYHVSGLAWRAGHGDLADNSESEVKKIFSPCAAAALYRRDAFVEANGFDEDFFCYMEDVDLGFRLRLLGYRCLYVPESVVHHVGSATTGDQHSDFAVYHGHRNLVWTYVKNMPGLLFWLFLPLHVVLNFMTCINFLWMGQGRVILKAKWDAIRGVPRMWAKRRHIQKNRRVSLMDIWRIMDKRIILRPPTKKS
ncbi:MAG: glycosyltransferase family 2 protein [Smithellaceae bacterium]